MKKEQTKTKNLFLCHDEDCPSCGFPETLDVVREIDMKLIKRICSKRCGWEISANELIKLNQK